MKWLIMDEINIFAMLDMVSLVWILSLLKSIFPESVAETAFGDKNNIIIKKLRVISILVKTFI